MKSQRILLFLFLAVAGILVVQLFAPKDKDTPPAPETATTQPATAPIATRAADAPAPPAKNGEATGKTAWQIRPGRAPGCAIGSLLADDGYLLQLDLCSEGAAIRSVRLTEYFQTVDDKQLFEKLDGDEVQYTQAAAKDPAKYQGHYTVIGPVTDKKGTDYALATREVKLFLGEDRNLRAAAEFGEMRHRRWRLVKTETTETQQRAIFEWPIYRKIATAGPAPRRELALTLRKTYTVTKGSYSIGVSLAFVNHTPEPMRLEVDQGGVTGVKREGMRIDERMAIVARREEQSIQRQDYNVSKLSEATLGVKENVGRSDAVTSPVVWMAYANKFFGAVLYLQPTDYPDHLNAADQNVQYYLAAEPQAGAGRTWRMGMWLNDLVLAPTGQESAARTLSYDLFTGPKERKLFRDTPLYARLRYVETISTGGCGWLTFDWLMVGLMWLLGFFADHLFFGNYGLAIILLVFIVRVLLHPLTKKSQVSMAKMGKVMAELKPQLEKIKEKYANDKATQQREMLKLQKQAGVGPGQMLGCLPMLLQMPIWIALYSGLNTEVVLRHAAFLPVWITDLAAPDHLFGFGRDLWLVGPYFNLLPILLTVAMYLSMKLNPATATRNASPEQAQQQKMMKLLMPGMMLFFFYKAPSGLTLYIMASTFAGVIEQYYIRKHIREQEEIQAAGETIVTVSGKGPRESRPKKPKGPLWTKRG